MSEQLQLIGVFGGLAILLVSLGIAARADRSYLQTRLQTYLGSWRRAPASDETEVRRKVSDDRHPFLRRTGLGTTQQRLTQAGLSISPGKFLLFQLMGILAGALLARLLVLRFGIEDFGLLPVLILGGIVGLLLTQLLVYLRRKRRLEAFERQFPSALDTIANAIQAGLSLPQAIDVMSRDMPPPCGGEFGQVIRELGMGIPLEEALDNLALRVPLGDVEIFVAAVHIQYRTGGDLSGLLHRLAHTMRERLRVRGEIRILTAQQRLSAVIVGVIPFAIVGAIKFLSPAYFDRLLEPGTMRIMLIAAAAGMMAGFYAMIRIADIEV
jgi:tight adherence protein B